MASAVIELRDLQFVLANTATLLEMKYGLLTVEHIQWMSDITDKYEGNESNENIKPLLDKFKELPQEKLKEAASLLAQTTETGSSLKLFEPSYVLSRLSEIPKLSSDLQLLFHELFRKLKVANQEIPKLDAIVKMSFDSSISDENHERLRSDLRSRYVFVAGVCKQSADKIEAIIEQVQKTLR